MRRTGSYMNIASRLLNSVVHHSLPLAIVLAAGVTLFSARMALAQQQTCPDFWCLRTTCDGWTPFSPGGGNPRPNCGGDDGTNGCPGSGQACETCAGASTRIRVCVYRVGEQCPRVSSVTCGNRYAGTCAASQTTDPETGKKYCKCNKGNTAGAACDTIGC